MLQNLYIRNLALIDEMEVDFQNGLNILTGETGAGKSIILGSINLALGSRYSSDILRSEEEPGLVELTFTIENETQKQLLREMDLYLEDAAIVLSRKMMGKRSVSKINGETVNASVLKEVAGILIDIHGQHEHQSLLYKKNHLEILDSFAKDTIADVKQQVSQTYDTYKAIKSELEASKMDERERIKEAGFLEFEIKEIEEANLKLGEDENLEEDYRRMVNGKRIAENIDETYSYTNVSNENASDLIGRAIRSLQDAARYDEKVLELYNQLSEVDNLLNDFNHELSDYRSSLEFSEEDFFIEEEFEEE